MLESHKSAAILCLVVCVCDILNKTSMHLDYLISQPFSALHC